MKQNKHMPDWAKSIYLNSFRCPSIWDVIELKLDKDAYMRKPMDVIDDCIASQIVAEYLGWA